MRHLFSPIVCLLLVLCHSHPTGTIQDMEHIVIFMQENRAFDHYYGTLKGVRGFNDRSAPPLPSGRSPFYQPTQVSPPARNSMCGCNACTLSWLTIGDNEIQELFNSLDCDSFVGLLAGAVPSVNVTDGLLCSEMFTQVVGTTIQHMKVSYMLSSHFTCPADLKVNLTSKNEAQQITEDDSYMLPFHLAFNETSATCMPAPEMDYPCDLKMWNNGRMDAWNTGRDPGFGMSYFERSDLPYYFALADAFTVGDQYFQSTFTPTNPNRLHQFSGSNGLSVNVNGTVIVDDSEPSTGINWETLGETFEKANITWKVYQEEDNFDDNAFEWFEIFKKAQPGDPLYEKGKVRVATGRLVDEFYQDLKNRTLPQVSIIIAPTWLSEHATNHPQDGEDLTARLMAALSAPENAEIYAKTAFIHNYDEGGQFYDHHWTPTPPVSEFDGKSTVTTDGEVLTRITAAVTPFHPIGLGFRVPLMIISPWTRGAFTYSEVSDHTSVIKLIEKRFGVRCPNISPWRRAIVSDLTAAFDFEHPDYSWPVFPSTKNNTNESKSQCAGLPYPEIPKVQSFPVQEEGTRLTRPLPYDFEIRDKVENGSLVVYMRNIGKAGAAFNVYDINKPINPPKKYTVEAGKELSDTFPIVDGKYNYSLHGPNGFVRKFAGYQTAADVAIEVGSDIQSGVLVVAMKTGETEGCDFLIKDESGVSSFEPMVETVPAGEIALKVLEIEETGFWYDFSIAAICKGVERSFRRVMGHLEVKRVTTTDPAMARRNVQNGNHPLVPERYRSIDKNILVKICKKRRSRHKDECWEILNMHEEL